MKTKMKTLIVAGIAGFMLALTGCASDAEASTAGTWGDTGSVFLTLEEGGQLSGNDGCNTIAGGWSQDGDTVEFGEVATTLMACEGFDAWLGALDTAVVTGDTLTVYDDSGAEIGSLDRG